MKDLGTSKNVSAHSDGVHLNACEAAAQILKEAGRGQYCLALQKSSAGLRGTPAEFSREICSLLEAIAPVCKAKRATFRHAQTWIAFSVTLDAFKSLAELNKTEALHDRAPPRPDDADVEQRIRHRRERLHARLDELTKELTLQMRKLAAELVLKTTAHARGLSGDLSPIHIAYCATGHLLTQTRLLGRWTECVAEADDDLALRQRLVSLVATFCAALAEARGIIPFPGHHWIYWIESPQPSALRIFNEHVDWLASKLLTAIAPDQLSRMTSAPSRFKLDQRAIDPQKLDVDALVNLLRCRYGLDYSQLATDLMEEELLVLSNAPKLRAEFAPASRSRRVDPPQARPIAALGELRTRIGSSGPLRTPSGETGVLAYEIKVLVYEKATDRKTSNAHVISGNTLSAWALTDRQLEDLQSLAQGTLALRVNDTNRKRVNRLIDRFREIGVRLEKERRAGSYLVKLGANQLRVLNIRGEIDRKKGLQAVLRDINREIPGHVR